MEITINGKVHQLHFGIKFLRELDEKNYRMEGPIRFGLGAQMAFTKLQLNDLLMLFDVLKAGLNTEMTLSDALFDEFYNSLTEKEIDQLYKNLVKNLETQPSTVRIIKAFKKAMKQGVEKKNV